MNTTPQVEEGVELTAEEIKNLPFEAISSITAQLETRLDMRKTFIKTNRQKAQMDRDLRRRVRKRQAKARTASRHSKKK